MSITDRPDGSCVVRVEMRHRAGSPEAAARARTVLLDHKRAGEAAANGAVSLSSCPTIRDLLEPFLLSRRVEEGALPATLAAHRRRLLRFARDLGGAAGDVPLDAIGRDQLNRWMDRRLAERGRGGNTIARATVRNDVASLWALARWGRHRGVPAHVPMFDVRIAAPSRRDEAAPQWAMQRDWLRMLGEIEAAAPDVALVLMAMVAFGRRPGVICALLRRRVRFPAPRGAGVASRQLVNGSVWFRTVKKGERGELTVPPGSLREKILRRALVLSERVRGRRPKRNEPMFLRITGRRADLGWTAQSFSDAVAKLRVALGLPEWFVAYTSRHSLGTWLKQEGVNRTATRHVLGHKSDRTQDGYDHTSGIDAEPGFAAIERMLSGACEDLWMRSDGVWSRA